MGWRRDHFSGLGKLEGDVQLCVTSRERLQSKTCLSALLPEISHMGKLVLGESVGSGGPRSLRGHGRTPAGIRTSARWPSEDFHRQSQTLRGGLSTRPFSLLGLLSTSKLDLNGDAVDVKTDLAPQLPATIGILLCKLQTLKCLESLPCNNFSPCSPVRQGSLLFPKIEFFYKT